MPLKKAAEWFHSGPQVRERLNAEGVRKLELVKEGPRHEDEVLFQEAHATVTGNKGAEFLKQWVKSLALIDKHSLPSVYLPSDSEVIGPENFGYRYEFEQPTKRRLIIRVFKQSEKARWREFFGKPKPVANLTDIAAKYYPKK